METGLAEFRTLSVLAVLVDSAVHLGGKGGSMFLGQISQNAANMVLVDGEAVSYTHLTLPTKA